MRIDILGLQAFVNVAECGSFQQAAAHLNLSQAALSHRMKRFEEYLGLKLFSRNTRHVTLTPAGIDLLPKAIRTITDVQNSLNGLREYSKAKQQYLTIGCIPTLASRYLPTLLCGYAEAHPEITIKVYDNSAAEIAAHVDSGAAEFAISIVSQNRSDIDVRPLLKEPFVLVAPANHPLAARKFVHWEDLRAFPLVRISPQTRNRTLIDDALRDRHEGLLWRYEVQHVATALSMVSAGMGVAILPGLTVGLARPPSVVAIPLRNPSISRHIGIISRRGVPLSPAAEELVKHVQGKTREFNFFT